jgi:outer membrane protein assembly factor BamE (lipoprotein component of BamABCDE complex)
MARTLTLTLLLAAAAGCSQTPPPAKPPATPAPKPADPAPPPAAAKADAAPEPDPKSKYSLAQYAKLKIGMTEDEVRAVLGEPTSKFEPTKWRYAEAAGADAHVIYVDFEGGKVANKGASGFVAIDAAKLTKENVAKVRIGMTEAEVVALLGPGNPSETANNTVLSYTHGEKRVPIVFAAGKVAAEPQPAGFDEKKD